MVGISPTQKWANATNQGFSLFPSPKESTVKRLPAHHGAQVKEDALTQSHGGESGGEGLARVACVQPIALQDETEEEKDASTPENDPFTRAQALAVPFLRARLLQGVLGAQPQGQRAPRARSPAR